MKHPLMPKATAVWLIENTALTFEQIAHFCGLHILEIQNLADEDYGIKIRPSSPVINSQLTHDEIKRCENDPQARLTLHILSSDNIKKSKKIGKKYTPISKRQDKPDTIYFLVKKYPELSDPQICKLIGTTKSTVKAIRDRTHWKMNLMRDVDPVTSGFCKQFELEAHLKQAQGRVEREKKQAAAQSNQVVDPDNNPLQDLDNLNI